jgi:hypothetical protein
MILSLLWSAHWTHRGHRSSCMSEVCSLTMVGVGGMPHALCNAQWSVATRNSTDGVHRKSKGCRSISERLFPDRLYLFPRRRDHVSPFVTFRIFRDWEARFHRGDMIYNLANDVLVFSACGRSYFRSVMWGWMEFPCVIDVSCTQFLRSALLFKFCGVLII